MSVNSSVKGGEVIDVAEYMHKNKILSISSFAKHCKHPSSSELFLKKSNWQETLGYENDELMHLAMQYIEKLSLATNNKDEISKISTSLKMEENPYTLLKIITAKLCADDMKSLAYEINRVMSNSTCQK